MATKNKKDVTIVLDEAKEVKAKEPMKDDVLAMTKELEDKLNVSGITVNAEAPKVKPVKMVKIKANKRHQCYIGGIGYFLEAGKQYNVPEEVKARLMKAGVLAPL